MKPVVHLVDDDAMFLRAIAKTLRISGYRIATYSSAAAFLKECDPEAEGCVVTDLSMPGQDGMDLQKELTMRNILLPVVFLTGQGDIPTTVQAMRNGAEDFLSKSTPRKELLDAIDRSIARCKKEREEVAREKSISGRLCILSSREKEILCLVAAGRLNKQIAAEIGIAERTVKFHRTSLTKKLNLFSAAELAVFARDAGILDD